MTISFTKICSIQFWMIIHAANEFFVLKYGQIFLVFILARNNWIFRLHKKLWQQQNVVH